MHARQFGFVIIFGCALITLGLVPGLFQGLQDAIRNFSASLSSPYLEIPPQNRRDYEKLPRPLWLAVIGLALILITLLTYKS
jgi:hypothetical protein